MNGDRIREVNGCRVCAENDWLEILRKEQRFIDNGGRLHRAHPGTSGHPGYAGV
jgi:hypothetical protein